MHLWIVIYLEHYKTLIMRIITFLFLITFLAACNQDLDNTTEAPVPQGFTSDDEFFPTVQPELRPFFIAFEEEAAERGFTFNLTDEGITGNIVDLGGGNIVGLCRRLDEAPNRIAVDSDAFARGSEAFRELVVFHELGHCVLEREHLDDSENGVCVSIMNSGTIGCELDLSDSDIREAYLDELFFF